MSVLILALCLRFSIQVNRVMTYRDLDNDLKYYSAFQTLVSQGHLLLYRFDIPFPQGGPYNFPACLCNLSFYAAISASGRRDRLEAPHQGFSARAGGERGE